MRWRFASSIGATQTHLQNNDISTIATGNHCNFYWLPLHDLAGWFEWDDAKAVTNYKKHGVRFEQAIVAFEDAFALVEFDDSEDYGEDRYLLTGRSTGGIVVVVFAERKGRIRIISAREATEYERRNYYRAAQED